MPHPDWLSRVYPPEYKPFHFHSGSKGLIMRIRDFLDRRKLASLRAMLAPAARILDIGCGDGRLMALLHSINPAWRMEGVDSGETAVRRALQRGLHVRHGVYENIPFEEGGYDLLVLNEVIEHIVDPGAVLEKVFRELKPGGLVNIETPSLDGWDARLYRSTHWGGWHFPRHLTFFTEATMTALLRETGFSVISVNYLPSPVFWVFSWHHAWETHIGKGADFFSDANSLALGAGTILDAIQSALTGKTSNMRVLARKV